MEAVVPARLQSYMSAGRPVLAMIGCGGADIIKESACGYSAPAENAEAFAELVRSVVLPNRNDFENKGYNGREYYLKHFTKEHCMNNLCKIMGI